MRTDPVIARRTALVVGLTGAGVATLAACSSESPSSGSSPPAATHGAAQPPAAADSTSSAPSEFSDSAASSTGRSSPAAGGTQVAKLDDIQVGGSIDAKLAGAPILVSRPTATTAACFSAICTHQGCTVKADGAKLACPCHGSVYDAKTGAVLQGPAPSPLKRIGVTVANGEVLASG